MVAAAEVVAGTAATAGVVAAAGVVATAGVVAARIFTATIVTIDIPGITDFTKNLTQKGVASRRIA